jgi:putative Ca2+/H+ antiporter (TMEM165/GDT1 family)
MSVARFWPVSAAGVMLIAAALGIAAVYATDAADGGRKGNGATLERTERSVAFREDMRKLWEDHIVWTRAFIVSFAADAGDQDEVAARLLANQDHIGDAIKPFYGEAAGEFRAALLIVY